MSTTSNNAEIPETMTAVRMYEYGGPEVMKIETHPVPKPADNEILMKVRASSVTWWDLAYRTGMVKPVPGRGALPMPQQLGREAAGDVVAIGRNVGLFAVGDRVVMMVHPACGQCWFCIRGLDNLCVRTELPAHQRFGGYAEYITVPEHGVMKAPDTMSYEKLACIFWSYATVYHMMHRRAKLRAGESVLITGASGGMGTAAIQLAKLAGAHPILALSSSSHKRSDLLKLGADAVMNYKDEDIEAQIRKHTADRMGVDVVLDHVGGPMATLGINAVRMSGRVVCAAVMGGVSIPLDLSQLFVKNINVIGSRASTRLDQQTILRLAAEGKIDPLISHTFDVGDVVESQRLLESGGHTGKIVLKFA